jgi:conjugative transfer region protein (TIGR03750 family)
MNEDRLADSVNSEPIVFMDCSGSEIIMSAIVGFVVGLFLGVVIGIVINLIMIGAVLGLILGLAFTYGLLNYLCLVRNKYYETWLKEKWFMLKLRSGFFGLTLIEESVRYGRGARTHE